MSQSHRGMHSVVVGGVGSSGGGNEAVAEQRRAVAKRRRRFTGVLTDDSWAQFTGDVTAPAELAVAVLDGLNTASVIAAAAAHDIAAVRPAGRLTASPPGRTQWPYTPTPTHRKWHGINRGNYRGNGEIFKQICGITRLWLKICNNLLISFKVNQIITPATLWHHNKRDIGHSTTLIIKSAFCTVCTVAKFVLEVCVSVNLAHVK